jgi:uncharacterized membrane protein
MINLGKGLVIAGIVFVAAGILLLIAPKVPFLGKLPGDIHIKKENFDLFIPVTTCVLLSLLFSGILWLFSFFWKK